MKLVSVIFCMIFFVGNICAMQKLLDPVRKRDLTEKLKNAIEWNRVKRAQSLITCGADVNYTQKDGFSLVMLAASLERIKICKLLIQAGANIYVSDNMRFTSLKYASTTKNKALCEMFVELMLSHKNEVYTLLHCMQRNFNRGMYHTLCNIYKVHMGPLIRAKNAWAYEHVCRIPVESMKKHLLQKYFQEKKV